MLVDVDGPRRRLMVSRNERLVLDSTLGLVDVSDAASLINDDARDLRDDKDVDVRDVDWSFEAGATSLMILLSMKVRNVIETLWTGAEERGSMTMA